MQAGDAVFAGDLFNPQNHAWLELDRIDDWLARLAQIRALKPNRIYPGRGASGDLGLIEKQAGYLRYVQQAVNSYSPSGSIGSITKMRLQWQIEREYPSLSYPIFMRDGIGAVWDQEARKRR